MKILHKFAYLPLIAALATGFTACSDDDAWTPAPAVPEECMGVAFSAENENILEISPAMAAGYTIPITVTRTKSTEAASVPLKFASATPEYFDCPATVEFAAGASEVTFDLTLKGGEKDCTYRSTISIDDPRYADPYTVVGGGEAPVYSFEYTVVQWNPIGIGTYTYTAFLSGDDEGLLLEQKDGENLYRIGDWGYGVTLFFTMDDANKIKVAKQAIGYNHPSYGPVSIESVANTDSYYDPSANQYRFAVKYTVSAGSFGSNWETFTITQPAE